jgi:hypothetical protein
MELIDRAIERRNRWAAEGDLADYRAHARGHIYFLYDLGRNTARNLIKADQLALDLYWRSPDWARQVIVGRRDLKVLPTNVRYHLDHLTVVMDNYADRIHMGEGAEVRDVPHPAAADAPDVYEYRLTDSLTLVMPQREIRVYKVEVRPQDPSAPAILGALFLDRSTADIVKMEFTFTASAYIDETVDYINVHLENAMWQGQYWLPFRQGIELRREFEILKFPAGSIIRAELRIRDYEFNTSFPAPPFRGRGVATLPKDSLESFQFEEGLYDALDPDIALTSPSLEEIRDEATRIVSERYLQKVQPMRMAVPGASSVFRFRRAEGLYLGPGVHFGLPRGGDFLILGGYAIGAERIELEGRVRIPLPGSMEIGIAGYYERVDDVSTWQASSGAVATLAAVVEGEDFREPYWFSGGRLFVGWPFLSSRGRALVAWERWEAATLQAEKLFTVYRPVRELDAGEVVRVELGLDRPPAAAVKEVGGTSWSFRVDAASPTVGGDFEYVHAALDAQQFWPGVVGRVGLRLSGAVGGVGGSHIPAQRLFPNGGRGSVRGYAFHKFVGNLYAVLGIELSRDIYHPYVSAAVFADAGWTGIEGESAGAAVARWNRVGAAAGSTDGGIVGVGAGVALFFDILHFDVARGVTSDGEWEFILRVRREFWPWL